MRYVEYGTDVRLGQDKFPYLYSKIHETLRISRIPDINIICTPLFRCIRGSGIRESRYLRVFVFTSTDTYLGIQSFSRKKMAKSHLDLVTMRNLGLS